MTEKDIKILEKVRSRGWILTIPKVYNGDLITVDYIAEKLDKYAYFIFQLEKGEETGYEHYQLWLEHSNPIKKITLVRLLPFAAIRERRGTKQYAFDYVTKEETRIDGPFEYGERPEFNDKNTSSGKREQMIIDISNGASDFDLLMKYPTIYSKRVVDDYRSALGIKDYYLSHNRDVQVYYLSGPAGSGKSSFVRRLFDIEDIYVVSDYEKDPFGSYTGQDVLVLEEYRSDFTLSVFLQYLDRYPIMLPARYNNKVAKFTKVFIISNWDFTEQYSFFPIDDKKAFWRRITSILKIKKDFINRYSITEDYGIKATGSCVNPIGQFKDLFPFVTSFEELMEVGFDE